MRKLKRFQQKINPIQERFKEAEVFKAQEIDVRNSPYLSFCLENGTLLDGSKASSSFTETLQILLGG